MSAETRISSKGQVVIPKDLRDRLRWLPGTRLELIETPGGVTMRAKFPEKTLTIEEGLARLRELSAPYRPPAPLSIEEISSVPEEALRQHYSKKYPPREKLE